jgi:hypothetical protein
MRGACSIELRITQTGTLPGADIRRQSSDATPSALGSRIDVVRIRRIANRRVDQGAAG